MRALAAEPFPTSGLEDILDEASPPETCASPPARVPPTCAGQASLSRGRHALGRRRGVLTWTTSCPPSRCSPSCSTRPSAPVVVGKSTVTVGTAVRRGQGWPPPELRRVEPRVRSARGCAVEDTRPSRLVTTVSQITRGRHARARALDQSSTACAALPPSSPPVRRGRAGQGCRQLLPGRKIQLHQRDGGDLRRCEPTSHAISLAPRPRRTHRQARLGAGVEFGSGVPAKDIRATKWRAEELGRGSPWPSGKWTPSACAGEAPGRRGRRGRPQEATSRAPASPSWARPSNDTDGVH